MRLMSRLPLTVMVLTTPRSKHTKTDENLQKWTKTDEKDIALSNLLSQKPLVRFNSLFYYYSYCLHTKSYIKTKTMSDSTRKNSMHRERTIASINATAAETPTQQSLSPSLASVKSYDSTIMQSNLDDQQQHPSSQAQAGSSKRASRIKSTSNSKIHKDNDEKKNALNATPMSSSSLRGQLPLPTPLDVSECPLFCCFYAEFDIKVGPKICFQSPQGFMEQDMEVSIDKIHNILQSSFQSIQKQEGEGTSNREQQQQPDADTSSQAEIPVSPEPNECKDGALSIFDSCTEYIITGHELTGNLLNLSSHQMHILTRPTILHDERYERNSLLFCVGFVLRRAGDPRLFRPILSKWALTLRDLELETHYLSTQATRLQLQGQLDRMLVSLNSAARECFLYLTPAHVLSLRLFHPPRPPPEPVPNHVVPVLLRRDWQFQMVRCPLVGVSRYIFSNFL